MGKAAKRTARERLAEQRRLEAQRRKRNRTLAIIGGALAVIVIVVVGVVVVQNNRTSSADYAGKLAPITKESQGRVVMAQKGVSGPVLDIYEDFQCPICGEFEKQKGDTVKRLAAEGKVKVVYHPMTIFSDQGPSKAAHDNSVRALNASMAAPAGKWLALHDKLYAHQPDETKAGGFPLNNLVTWGKQAGITDPSFAKAVKGMSHKSEAEQNTQRNLKSGIEGTPTIKVNDKDLNLEKVMGSPDALKDAVNEASTNDKK